jgi:hypothetical protein
MEYIHIQVDIFKFSPYSNKLKFTCQTWSSNIAKKLSCDPMSVPITIIIITLTTHNIEITWMVHHIQTKRLTHLQQRNNPSPKHRKPKHLHNTKNYKVKTMLWNLKSLRVIWGHTRWDYILWQIFWTMFTP